MCDKAEILSKQVSFVHLEMYFIYLSLGHMCLSSKAEVYGVGLKFMVYLCKDELGPFSNLKPGCAWDSNKCGIKYIPSLLFCGSALACGKLLMVFMIS